MLTDGDETSAQNVQANLDAFVTQQNKLIESFKSPENLKLLREQHAIIMRYQSALVTMRKAYVESAVSRDDMDSSSKMARDAMDSLKTLVLQRSAMEEGRFEQLQAISTVREQFCWRATTYASISPRSPANERAARRQLEVAIASLGALTVHFSANAPEALRSLDGALARYKQALQVYVDTDQTITDMRKEMTVYGAALAS